MARVIVSGIPEFNDQLKRDMEKMSLAARQFVTEGADIIGDSAKEQFRARPGGSRTVSKSGHVYYKGTGPYKAQRPNPTIRTGNLRSSISRKYVRQSGKGWESGTGPSMDYAPFVEFGTRYISAPAFPFMEMGVDNASERLNALAHRLFNQAQE